ncbi:putative ABC transport system permease protein [Algoriphagus locisalis]|uniref:Putative ABC transport system permease protein n=1 Tax=Algoriphagus locisalis TaxID=305507 RepID=A0A1I7BPG6_9BACT|nr:ABC transporter permease [Algoriphagus locisalis]SFT89021.1 putative ABC transport system permease protein [Algoriphagus locisalis]
MWKNYLKIAFRSLVKRRLFTMVNLLGLVLGLVAFLGLFAYVATEWSYNDFHANKDRIYRIVVSEGEDTFETFLPPGYAGVLETNFSDIASAGRFVEGIAGGLVAIPETDLVFREDGINFVEDDFFETFSFPIARGTADLAATNTAVITEDMADKFFSNSDPIGKSFLLSNQFGKQEFTVTGVLESIPFRSDITGDIFLSINTLENPANRSGNDWADPNGFDSGFVNLFVMTKAGVDSEDLAEQLTSFIRQTPNSEETTIVLQDLPSLHLGNSISDPLPTSAEMGAVLVFLAIAILILAIAYVNYLNLSSANILTRIKEIKMRKVLGAHSWQLANQFMTETLVLLLTSLLVSIVGLHILAPYASAIFGKEIWFESLKEPQTILIVSMVIGVCTLISGFYVVVISGKFDTKSQVKFKPDSQLLRKSLVVFQFVISIGIIICTLVIRDQLSFMQSQSLGMNVAQKLVVAGPNDVGENRSSKMDAFKQSLASQIVVKGIAGSNSLPGQGYNFSTSGITPLVARPEDKEYNYSMFIIDEQFIPIYEIEILAGRNFTSSEAVQGWNVINKVMLNESAAAQLGFENPAAAIGQNILWGRPFEVVGVTADYHHMSLRETIKPMIFLAAQADGFFTLVVDPAQVKEAISATQETYESIFPGNPFTYSFMDEKFAAQYEQEAQLSLAFSIAGILAIMISCLGLFGLAAYAVQQRTKEIGIRKVLGASTESLINLISKDFIVLVFFAMIFAFPLAYYAMNSWLADFPYKAGLSIWTFSLAGLLTLVIALVTVGFQAWKAAWANPAETLKSE